MSNTTRARRSKVTKSTNTKPARGGKTGAKKDALGSRVGSQAAKINACLGREPKSVEAIAKEAKLQSGRVRAHLRSLVAKDAVVELYILGKRK